MFKYPNILYHKNYRVNVGKRQKGISTKSHFFNKALIHISIICIFVVSCENFQIIFIENNVYTSKVIIRRCIEKNPKIITYSIISDSKLL